MILDIGVLNGNRITIDTSINSDVNIIYAIDKKNDSTAQVLIEISGNEEWLNSMLIGMNRLVETSPITDVKVNSVSLFRSNLTSLKNDIVKESHFFSLTNCGLVSNRDDVNVLNLQIEWSDIHDNTTI